MKMNLIVLWQEVGNGSSTASRGMRFTAWSIHSYLICLQLTEPLATKQQATSTSRRVSLLLDVSATVKAGPSSTNYQVQF